MSEAQQPLILLTGATGYVGGRFLKTLEHAGRRVRCLARRPEFLDPKQPTADSESVKPPNKRLWNVTKLLSEYLNKSSESVRMMWYDTA